MILMPNEISLTLIQILLNIIHQESTGLDRDDPTRLRLIEVQPRSEEFADLILSCSISPNDPDNPDDWLDEEIVSPGNKYNIQGSKSYLEIGGSGQFFNLRFTASFTLFFQDLGIDPDVALESSRLIMARIHRAVLREGSSRRGAFSSAYRTDDFGVRLTNASRAVKKRVMLPRGSSDEAFYKGKMYFQFEVLLDPEE